MLSETSQAQKDKHWMNPFIWGTLKSQIHKKQKSRIVVTGPRGREEWGVIGKWGEFQFGMMEKVLEMNVAMIAQ